MLAAALALTGCFNQRHEFRPADFVQADSTSSPSAPRLNAREWIVATHRRLRHLLPLSPFHALLTADLSGPDGAPADVFGHFWINPRALKMLLPNLFGFLDTVSGSASSFAINEEAEPWPGFRTVWIPVRDDFALCGRLGLAHRNGTPIESTCVIILPGFYGDHSVTRSHALAEAFVSSGIHALSIELRGHGQVERRYPDHGYTFGVLESVDLLRVNDWLIAQPPVSKVGMVGFCWGANTALLAAWLDGRPRDDPGIGPTIQHVIPPPDGVRRFEAGILGFSPAVQFEESIDACDAWISPAVDPTIYALQQVVRWRIKFKNFGRPHYSLRRLIDKEYANSELPLDQPRWKDALRFLRFLHFKGRPAGEKLQHIRVPTLIVHASNDPFIPAERIAELLAPVANPNVAAIILPGGGHIGFAPYSRRYFYSLLLNFFHPRSSPVAADPLPAHAD